MKKSAMCAAITVFLQAVVVIGATTVAERRAAWRQHVELERTSPFRHLEWRALGPTRQGGRIEAIACPPGYNTTIYLGVGSGNLWKTTNNGITWTPIFENESTFTIGDVAVSFMATVEPDLSSDETRRHTDLDRLRRIVPCLPRGLVCGHRGPPRPGYPMLAAGCA